MSNLSENILQAIDSIVEKRLGEVNFDTTIVCEVLSNTNKDKNEYTVSNDNTTFTAYSNGEMAYVVGQKVYVTVPCNNYSLKKIIVGSYTSDDTSAYQYVNPWERIITVGGNLVSPTGEPAAAPISVIAKDNNELTLDETISSIHHSISSIPLEIEDNKIKYIAIKATFETYLESTKGNYGLLLSFCKNDSQEPSYQIAFDSSEFYGNPYYYDGGFEQQKIVSYPEDADYDYLIVGLYQKGNFNYLKSNDEKNKIIVKDINISLAYDQADFKEDSFTIKYINNSITENYSNNNDLVEIKPTYISYNSTSQSYKELEIENNLKVEEKKIRGLWKIIIDEISSVETVRWDREYLINFVSNGQHFKKIRTYSDGFVYYQNINGEDFIARGPSANGGYFYWKEEYRYLDFGENFQTVNRTDFLMWFKQDASLIKSAVQQPKWFRYRVGNADVGGGIHWEQLFRYDEEDQLVLATNQLTAKLLISLNKYNKEASNDILNEALKKFRENVSRDWYGFRDANKIWQIAYFGQNPPLKTYSDTNGWLYVSQQGQPNYEEVWNKIKDRDIVLLQNYIERPIGPIFTNSTNNKFIGKTGEGIYRPTTFPNTNYQTEQIKTKYNNKYSNILKLEYNGQAVGEVIENIAQINLQATSTYYPNFDEGSGDCIQGSTGTITASFFDGTNWGESVKSITWKVLDVPFFKIKANDVEAPIENGYQIIRQTKGETNVSSFINYDLQNGYTGQVSLVIRCEINNNPNFFGEVKIYFDYRGSSGTDYTLRVTPLNINSRWPFFKQVTPTEENGNNDFNREVIKVDIIGPKGQVLDISDTEWNTNLEYQLLNNEIDTTKRVASASYNRDESNGRCNQVTISITRMTGVSLSSSGRYFTTILKIIYKNFSLENGRTVNLIKTIPLGITNSDKEITVPTELIYDSAGLNLTNFNIVKKPVTIDNSHPPMISNSEEQKNYISIYDSTVFFAPKIVLENTGQNYDNGYYLGPVSINTMSTTLPAIGITFRGPTIENTNGFAWVKSAIILRRDNYGTALLQNWNNETVVDKDNNAVFTQLLVAGKLEGDSNNQFTGVVIGNAEKANRECNEYGIYGFKNGTKSFSLDVNGDAYLAGKIEAKEGEIGGWHISNSELLSYDYTKVDAGDKKPSVHGGGSGILLDPNLHGILIRKSLGEGDTNYIDSFQATPNGDLRISTDGATINTTTGTMRWTGDITAKSVSITNSLQVNRFGTVSTSAPQDYMTKLNTTAIRANMDNYSTTHFSFYLNENGWYNDIYQINYSKEFTVEFNEDNDNSWYANIMIANVNPIDGGVFTKSIAWSSGERNKVTVPAGYNGYYLIRNSCNSTGLGLKNPTGTFSEDTTTTFELGSNGKCTITGGQFSNCKGNDSNTVNSDRNLKNTITPLSAPYLNLLKSVEPVTYKYNDGTSDRLHTGFIAQQVEEQLVNAGLTTQDFAALVIDKGTGHYGLRYEEFIALNTLAIQDLYKIIESLQAKIVELENKLQQQDT